MTNDVGETCRNHPDQPAIANCNKCGAPICADCRKEYGYFCGEGCLAKSVSTVDYEAKARRERELEATIKAGRIVKLVVMSIVLVSLGIIGWFVWVKFFDPSGTVKWRWAQNFKRSSYIILSETPKAFVAKTGDSVAVIDPESGKILSVHQNPEFKKYNKLVKAYEKSALISGESCLALYDFSGVVKWERKFDGVIVASAASDELVMVAARPKYNLDDLDEKEEEKKDYRARLYSYAVSTGKKIGSKKMKKDTCLSGSLDVGENCFVYAYHQFDKENSAFYLRLDDASTGKSKWRVKLDQGLSWGPKIFDGAVVFKTGDTISAVSLDGRQKLWSVAVKGYFSSDEIKPRDNLLFLYGDSTLTCIDLKEKKALWSKSMKGFFGDYKYDDGRLFLLSSEERIASVTSSPVKIPPRFEQLKDQDLMKAFTTTGPVTKYDNILTSLDARTGKELWKRKKVQGELVVGYGRLVMLSDTALTSRLNLSNKGMGLNVIRQFDPNTGRDYYTRQETVGAMAPYIIINNRLIAIEYERITTGVNNAPVPTQDDPNCMGIVGFRLK